MRTVIYSIWGVAVLSLLGAAQWTGYSFTSATMNKTNPRSIRANPGSYRSPYYLPGRTLRGK